MSGTVEVKRSEPRIAELTALPLDLVEHFENQGKQILLVHGGPVSMAENSSWGRTPVYYDDLPPNLQALCRSSFENPEKHGGLLSRGNAMLVEQSFEQRDFFRGINSERQRQMEDASDFAHEGLNEMVQQKAHDAGFGKGMVEVRQVSRTRVRDQGIGGQELLEEALRQEKKK